MAGKVDVDANQYYGWLLLYHACLYMYVCIKKDIKYDRIMILHETCTYMDVSHGWICSCVSKQ